MDSTLRGSHTCFVCNHAMIWATDFSGGGVILHGSEVAANHVVASDRMSQTSQVEFSIQLTCPHCNAVNQFKSKHTV